MSKLKEMNKYRLDGMTYALDLVRKGGVELLEKEVKFRNQTGINYKMTTEEYDAASKDIKLMTVSTVMTMAIAVLHDEFDFGRQRCQRFADRMDKKVDDLSEGIVTWQEYVDQLNQEMGLGLQLWHND